ncbi:hypothetical protein YB2330_005241 [Saitoella coloradoensis]
MSNQAAWIKESKANPVVVDSAPVYTPGKGEVVVKNAAAAINPVDWKIQDSGYFINTYPNILGTDVAGTIEEVGEGVTEFKKGDRVLAYAASLGLGGKPEYAGFQKYTLAPSFLVTKLPENVSFDQGAVLPLGLATAAHGLFSDKHLNLVRPSGTPEAPRAKQNVLIWGGSSSVGASAVQLAARSGYTVISTASAHNHDLVISLGAAKVFDYKDPEVVSKIQDSVSGGEWVGAFDAISEGGSVEKSAEVIKTGKVATTLPPPENLPEGIQASGVFAGLLATQEAELGKWLFNEYLPGALADGQVKPAPAPLVVEGGLEGAQKAMDTLKKGVSGKKVVINP